MTELNKSPTDFLKLKGLLDKVLEFASTNQYQSPLPTTLSIEAFSAAMRETFILYEEIALLLEFASKSQFEKLSVLHEEVYSGLTNLIMACPEPELALGAFDYQNEYNARLEQLRNLTTLMDWHQSFYQIVLQRVPLLPIPLHLTTDDIDAPGYGL